MKRADASAGARALAVARGRGDETDTTAWKLLRVVFSHVRTRPSMSRTRGRQMKSSIPRACRKYGATSSSLRRPDAAKIRDDVALVVIHSESESGAAVSETQKVSLRPPKTLGRTGSNVCSSPPNLPCSPRAVDTRRCTHSWKNNGAGSIICKIKSFKWSQTSSN